MKTAVQLPADSSGVSAAQFKIFQDFLAETCGIRLGDNKHYLLKSRLSGIIGKIGITSIDELVTRLVAGKLSERIMAEIVDAMTINETFWFRDNAHFELLRHKLFSELFHNGIGSPRIWSAGCSSGQEPYSISIAAHEYFQTNIHAVYKNPQIIGTDISESILNQARKAVYSDLELSRGINGKYRSFCFERHHQGWKLKPEIACRVRFQPFNLLKSFKVLGCFDVIFCRNVLIYFSDEIKKDILSRMAGVMKPGGYLFLS
ncbi:protein-glutamate O-methyltransferase CheR, partial [bacterium]|nr:protein-glutamate O-methyltransferase CheR [bacterium]